MIWLIGCRGMLGSQILTELEKSGLEFCATGSEVDITDIHALERYAAEKDISWIINASAYTAVDNAESEEELAELVNGTGAGNIAEIGSLIGARLIHFSTDYVFDGEKQNPYLETDPCSPIGAYGRSKLSGEKKIAEKTDDFFIFRISWLYGVYGNNFVKTMLKLFASRDEMNIVNDQLGAPTYCGVLAQNIIRLVQGGSTAYGVYHYSDEGEISWYDFACEIMAQAADRNLLKKIKLNGIPSSEYQTKAKRPASSRMDKSKVKRLGFAVADWADNLRCFFDEMASLDKR